MNIFFSSYLAADQIHQGLEGNQGKAYSQRWLNRWWNRQAA